MDGWLPKPKDTTNTKLLRHKMVVEQLQNKGIHNQQVLQAMAEIPRHFFALPEYQDQAYNDKPIPNNHNQTISQPFIVAFMSQELEVRPGHKVLEIGTGSGYQAAILAHLGAKVTSVERIQSLHLRAKEILTQLGYQVDLRLGDSIQTIQPEEKFDRILFTCAIQQIPQTYLQHLLPNGILLAPIGNSKTQILTKFIENHGQFLQLQLLECVFVPLVGKYGFQKPTTE